VLNVLPNRGIFEADLSRARPVFGDVVLIAPLGMSIAEEIIGGTEDRVPAVVEG